ncbi:transcriptional regulator, LysR family [Tistlia consotensis]|uniref:Transcriptional regulator, LysR family n=1 Tax=Tistlia consotensis USBA 355 TaxID=560819 RepID=A0A1Y6B9H0_9PROT|nr:LysR family transcriptional regulator [Tistlia consotensis]SME91708.1 transcriptional regulator, LysR family [Tistlia consotensis USBA 355]SNR27569.1 transcriptional regulator, LysR family [Tistlia consotensis]
MRRLPISGLEVFLAIAREGSLRGAATALGLGAPAVSHQLKRFEQELGVDLFARTTRSVELTEAGRVLLKGADPAFGELADAVEAARGAGRSRTGTLRLTLPWSAYRVAIEPMLGAFRAAHPDVRLELSFDEALVDVVREGFHAGIRLGDRLTPGMVAVRITAPMKAAYSAAPAYLERAGRPRHPRDLLGHSCIRYRFISTRRIADWQFREDGRLFSVDPPAGLVFDSFQSVVQAAGGGHGIGWSLRAVVESELAAGRLESVLDAFTIGHPPFFLYYPEQNRRLELLRLFVAFLAGGGRR